MTPQKARQNPVATPEVAVEPDPVIQQAKRDLDRGLVDTDMRQTPGLDVTRRKQLVPTPTVPSDRDTPPARKATDSKNRRVG